jgi:hypothetical protein
MFNFNREEGLRLNNTWNTVIEKHKEDVTPRGSPRSEGKHHPVRDRPYLGRACKKSKEI